MVIPLRLGSPGWSRSRLPESGRKGWCFAISIKVMEERGKLTARLGTHLDQRSSAHHLRAQRQAVVVWRKDAVWVVGEQG